MELSELQTTLLRILSCALAGKTTDLDGEAVDWTALYHEALTQTVFAQVYYAVEASIPEKQSALWQKTYAKIIANNMRVTYEHAELHSLMTEKRIPYVSFKGCASADRYAVPLLRTMGDVDLLVHEEDDARAAEALQSAGFQPPADQGHSSHQAYHQGKSTWELHWRINGIPEGFAGDQTRAFLRDIIETAVSMETEEGTVLIPDSFHHGIVLLVHMGKHLINTGIGLRHLCDWAAFVSSMSSDEFIRLFDPALKQCGLWRFAQLMTQLSIRYLGISEQPWAMEELNDALLLEMIKDIFSSGNFGHKDRQRINQAKLLTNKEKGTVDDTGFLRQLVSTMNVKARIGMPVCRDVPVLLPIGWLYVGGRHLLRIGQGRRPEIDIMETIRGAEERQKIYREFYLYEK